MSSDSRLSYGRPRSATEWRALREALTIAFAIPPKDVPGWIRRAGAANFRVVREGREVGGGLALYPFGHFFGGRSVPAIGVAAVGILPHFRARGVGSFLMREAIREMARRGIPISTLRATSHQVALDFVIEGRIHGSHEPPEYGVVLCDQDQTIVHSHSYLDRSDTFLL